MINYTAWGLGAYVFVFCLGLILFFHFAKKRRDKEISDKWEEEEEVLYKVDDKIVEDVPNYAFVFVRYREMVFSMRVNEKAEIWDKMNRTQRNAQLDAMKKAAKRGEIKIEKLADDVWCYVPARENLKSVRDDYNTFISLGGKLEE